MGLNRSLGVGAEGDDVGGCLDGASLGVLLEACRPCE